LASYPLHVSKAHREQQEQSLQALHPLTKPPSKLPGDLIAWRNGSSLQGIPGGADPVRQYHPALFIMDEAMFMMEAADSSDAADPVSSQISSAGPGRFGLKCEELEGTR
jgi:hypothetical protein